MPPARLPLICNSAYAEFQIVRGINAVHLRFLSFFAQKITMAAKASRKNSKPTRTKTAVKPASQNNSSTHAGNFWFLLILIVLNLLVYGQTTGHDFVALDDITHIQKNPAYNPFTFSSLKEIWTKPYFDMYLPMTYTLWGIAANIGLMQSHSLTAIPVISPKVFHVFNIVVHCLNVIFAFYIFLRLTKNKSASFFAAAFFAIHPQQVESVAWVSAMKDLWSGFFSLLAILFFTLFRNPDNNSKQKLYYFCSIVFFVIATLAKPSMVSVFAIILCLDFFVFQQTLPRLIKASFPFLILSLPPIIWSKALQPDVTMDFTPPLWTRPLIAGDAITFYLSKVLLPISFGVDYGRSPQVVLSNNWIYFAWLIPLALLIVAWRKKNYRIFAAGTFGFCAAFAPYSGLILFNFQDFSTVADRYAYLPMFAASLALLGIISVNPSPFLRNCSIVVIALLALRSHSQASHWLSSESIFAHTLKVNPSSPIALNNLGVSLMERGKVAEAVPYFERSSNIVGRETDGLINWGLALSRLGKQQEALVPLTKALELQPDNSSVHLNLGNVYQKLLRYDEAIAQFKAGLKIKPKDLALISNLGSIYLEQKQYDSAIEQYKQALEINPDFPGAVINLAYTYQQKNDLPNAIAAYQKAIALLPEHSGIHTNLAIAYENVGEKEKAIAHFKLAMTLDPNNQIAAARHNQLTSATK